MRINLLKETEEELERHGKTWEDIIWIGNTEFTISLEHFKELSNKKYDNGYGAQEVSGDLLIVGEDWWLEREEYDGSESWEFKRLPQKPIKEVKVKRIIGGMWESLEEAKVEFKEGKV